jgi:hypothetical protein
VKSARSGTTSSLLVAALALVSVLTLDAVASAEDAGSHRGPLGDPGFFPIAVWLQSPRNAARYKAAGFNVYVGLWKGPTEEQLATLREAGMSVVCDQNEVGLRHRNDETIVGWMHDDEPDNAQSLGQGKGYGPPVTPERIVEGYKKLRAADPSRPVLLNLGQGVAWDGWYGRGVRTNHPEDYARYVQGSDIVSFDIYPATHDRAEIRGKLWLVAKGVDRLREWCAGKQIVWNCIECSRIADEKRKPTPQEVRVEVWMSLIHGSRGLIYFVHQFQPKFVEASLLEDPALLDAVAKINAEIHELAPVLNSPTVADGVTVRNPDASVPVDAMVKRRDGAVYIFAACMRDAAARPTLEVTGLPAKTAAEVLGENRTIPVEAGRLVDDFGPYAVHRYRIADRKSGE